MEEALMYLPGSTANGGVVRPTGSERPDWKVVGLHSARYGTSELQRKPISHQSPLLEDSNLGCCVRFSTQELRIPDKHQPISDV